MIVGLIGAFKFILVQLVLLVDFAHSWNESWVEKMEETESKCWMFALLFFTFIMYGLSIAGIVCMFIYFTQSDTEKCKLEKFVVSFELVLGVVISALAIHPKVQEKQAKSGTIFNKYKLSVNIFSVTLPIRKDSILVQHNCVFVRNYFDITVIKNRDFSIE